MKFEDLKLPYIDFAYDRFEDRGRVARAVYDQMRAHYEAKLAEAKPAPAWRLPDPPPGQQWHRTDWTQDMLPEGYRPLLLGEKPEEGDQILFLDKWKQLNAHQLRHPVRLGEFHQRTRRPLPTPVEYVPLEPGDVPPGSAVRKYDERSWDLVTSVDSDNLWVQGDCHPWQYLAGNYEILRPGSATWEPCKKPKA